MCQCVCARAPHKRVCAISLSLSLSLSLCIHRGIDNHKVRGKEHGPQAAGVRVRSVPAAIGYQHALGRCQQPPRDFVAADSQKFQTAAEGDVMVYEVCVLYINVSALAETLLLQNLSLSLSLPLSV